MGKIEMEDLISPFVEESFQALNPKFGIKMRGFATVGDTKTAPGFSFFRYKLQRENHIIMFNALKTCPTLLIIGVQVADSVVQLRGLFFLPVIETVRNLGIKKISLDTNSFFSTHHREEEIGGE